jgi:hypothetical protein
MLNQYRDKRVAREALYVSKEETLPVNLGHLELHLDVSSGSGARGSARTVLVQ